jgi:hypothetical protein
VINNTSSGSYVSKTDNRHDIWTTVYDETDTETFSVKIRTISAGNDAFIQNSSIQFFYTKVAP